MGATSDVRMMSLKFLVDKEKNRFLYAEVDREFVEILYGFMTVPMATILRFLKKSSDQNFMGLESLKALYDSISNLPLKYFFSEESKLMLLNPRNLSEELLKILDLKMDDEGPPKKRYFMCDDFNCTKLNAFATTYRYTRCYYCRNLMTREVIKSNRSNEVFVSHGVSFIITDDLCVMPNTSASSIPLLRDLGITDTSHLEESTVDFSLEEIRDLLKLALLSTSPLTYLLSKKTQDIGGLILVEKSKPDKPLISKDTAVMSKEMTLKVFLQKSTSKILFAEAEEDFVDLLIRFLTIPLGTLIGKLNGNSCLGSIDNLYRSILNIKVGRHMKSQDLKDMLLQPHLVKEPMSMGLKFQDPMLQSGFIKGVGTFMVSDDLVITPLSSISSISLLKKLKIPLSDIDVVEKEVSIGMEEGLRILKASLTSASALTNGLKLQPPLKKQKN